MLDEKDMAATQDEPVREAARLRDEEGAVRSEYVETVSEAIAGSDAGLLRALTRRSA